MLTLNQILFHIAHIATASTWLRAGLADTTVCLKNTGEQIHLLFSSCNHLQKLLVPDLQDQKLERQTKERFLKMVT